MTTPEPVDPNATQPMDTGDVAEVDPTEQAEVDEPEPNEDAGDTLEDVPDDGAADDLDAGS